jgi:hypothetical protein
MINIKSTPMLGYIDPGSGSYLVQMLIAAVLGAGYYFRSSWSYLKSRFRKDRKEDENLES